MCYISLKKFKAFTTFNSVGIYFTPHNTLECDTEGYKLEYVWNNVHQKMYEGLSSGLESSIAM